MNNKIAGPVVIVVECFIAAEVGADTAPVRPNLCGCVGNHTQDREEPCEKYEETDEITETTIYIFYECNLKN